MGDYRNGGRYDRRDSHRGGGDIRDRDRPFLPTADMMGSRIYIGKLPNDIRERELDDVFRKYGVVQEISLKGNYAFIQFQSSLGAKDAVYELNNRTLFGDRVTVEHARTPKEFGGKSGGGGRDGGGRDGGYQTRAPPPPPRGRYEGGGRGMDRGGGYDRGDRGDRGYDRGYDRSLDKGFDRGGRDRVRRDRSPIHHGRY